MRIGIVSPRINGLSVSGLAGLGDTDLAGQVSMYLNSFMVGLTEPGAATPDVVRETLTQAAKDSCAAANSMIGSSKSCDPTSVASQIDAAVATYTAAYNSAQANAPVNEQAVYAPVAAPVAVVTSTPVVNRPAQVQYSSQPPNALDRVTPQTSNVRGPLMVSSALTPPVTPAPMSGMNAGTFTATPTTTSGPGVLPATAPSGFNIPTWALLGAAALGIFFMVKGK